MFTVYPALCVLHNLNFWPESSLDYADLSLSPTSSGEKDKTSKWQFTSTIFTTQHHSRLFSGKETNKTTGAC